MAINNKVSLKCGVCGNANFDYDTTLYNSIDDADLIKCSVCSKTYTKKEIIEANSILISNTSEEMVREVFEKNLKGLGFKIEIK